jgi:hypothetical protein
MSATSVLKDGGRATGLELRINGCVLHTETRSPYRNLSKRVYRFVTPFYR